MTGSPTACSICGAALSAGEACPACTVVTPVPTDTAERRILTLCFVDLVASTELAERLGLEDYDSTLQGFLRLTESTIGEFRGRIIQDYGDGILACFGLDEGAEDAALAGLGCALALVSRIPQQLKGCNARVGLHAGTVLCRIDAAGDQRPQLTGLDLNIAARIEAEAHPATVLASDQFTAFVKRLADLDITDTRHLRLRGTSTETALHQIGGFRLVQTEASAKRLLERDDLIKRCLDPAQGHLLVAGPPGIGKTSLVQALMARAASDHPVTLLCARSNLTRSPMVPMTEWLRGLLPGEGDLSERLALSGITLSPDLHPALSEILNPLLTALPHPELALQTRRQNRIAAAGAILTDRLRDPKALLLFDDFHWCDVDSREVVSRLLRADPPVAGRILLFSRPNPDVLEFAATHQVDHVTVPALSDAAARRVMQGEVPQTFPHEVEERLIETSGGNPLFLRLLARAEALSPGTGNKSLPPPTIEATIQHLLGELGPLKETVLTASVIGRQFNLSHLRHLMDSSLDLDAQISSLTRLDVIFGEGDGHAFHHVLIRDCAYNMLPLRRRRVLHEAFARILLTHYPAEAATYPEIVADHFLDAEAMDEAIGPCLSAGVKFLGSASFEAATHYLETAVQTLAAHPAPDKTVSDLLIKGQTLLGATKVQRFGFSHPEVARAYEELDDSVTRLNASGLERMYALYGLFANSIIGGKVRGSRALLDRMEQIADPESPDQQILYLVNETAYLMYSGEFEAALRAGRKLQAVYDTDSHGQMFYLLGADPLVSVLSAESYIQTVLGRPDLGQAALEAALAHIDRIGARLQLPWLHIFAAQSFCIADERAAFQYHLETGLALADAQGAVFWTVVGNLWKSMDAVWQGMPAAGEAGLAQLIPTAEAIGLRLGWPIFASAQAEALAARGEWDAADKLSRAALERIDQHGERLWAAQVRASRGRIVNLITSGGAQVQA
jgi:class 3 adenylate cyclase